MQLVEMLLLALAAYFILSPAIRFFRAFRTRGNSQRVSPHRAWLPTSLMFLASLLLLPAGLIGARLFLSGSNYTWTVVLFFGIITGAFIDFLRVIKFGTPGEPGRKSIVFSAISLCIGLLLAVSAFIIQAPPVSGESIHLKLPVRGDWKVATGGKFELTNYHHDDPRSQNYAVDLVKYNQQTKGMPVYAPIDGVIKVLKSDWKPGDSQAEGNYVVIETSTGIEIWLAHLEEVSNDLVPGVHVETDVLLGRCGETGSAEVPHLHIHAQHDEQPVAIYFGDGKNFLVRNDRISSAR